MPFTVTWMQLKTSYLAKYVRKIKINDITYMWSLKYGINKPIYETKRDSADIQNRLIVAKEWQEVDGWTVSLGLVDANYYI